MSPTLEANLRRGTLDLLVLKLLSNWGSNGAGISRSLVSHGFPGPTNGSIYPCLRRLERRKWAVGQALLTEHRRVGRFYWLTKDGSAALAEQIDCWRRYSDAVERVLAKPSL